MIETRKSIARPRSSALKRPSCGTRRSVMSSSASTLTRAIACSACARSSISLICERMPSMRNLIARPAASGLEVDVARADLQRVAQRGAHQAHHLARLVADRLERQVLDAPRSAGAAAAASSRTASSARSVSSWLARKATRSPRCTRHQAKGSRDALVGPGLQLGGERVVEGEQQARRRRRAAATQPLLRAFGERQQVEGRRRGGAAPSMRSGSQREASPRGARRTRRARSASRSSSTSTTRRRAARRSRARLRRWLRSSRSLTAGSRRARRSACT